MPIEYAPNFTKKYNPTNCEELGMHRSRRLRCHRGLIA